MSRVELRGVSKAYGAVPAVQHVDLTIEPGSRTAIVGPSGSGKTTLLRLIAGFEMPDSGSIALGGQVLAGAAAGSGIAVPVHKRGIGFVPQDGALFPHLTVEGNIGFGLSGLIDDSAARRRRIAELMAMVALDGSLLKRWPHELSGGQQQRVALARALAQRPRLMLLDEPFSALDTGLRAETRRAVAQLLAEAGITTVLVTHDQAEALSFAHQLAVMRAGRLVQVGGAQELYWRPLDEATAAFLGEAIVLPAQVAGGWAACDLGRVAVTDITTHGAASIMLRPEQLHLVAAPLPAAGEGEACSGQVTAIDFGGHGTLVTVKLDPAAVAGAGTPAPGRTLLVRCASDRIPAPGATVRISVRGAAHVLREGVTA